jgi:hypothetical protein
MKRILRVKNGGTAEFPLLNIANPKTLNGVVKLAGSQIALSQARCQAVSKREELGIPGIRYLDAGSRDGGSGTRNFVVFPGEEKKVRILERK